MIRQVPKVELPSCYREQAMVSSSRIYHERCTFMSKLKRLYEMVSERTGRNRRPCKHDSVITCYTIAMPGWRTRHPASKAQSPSQSTLWRHSPPLFVGAPPNSAKPSHLDSTETSGFDKLCAMGGSRSQISKAVLYILTHCESSAVFDRYSLHACEPRAHAHCVAVVHPNL